MMGNEQNRDPASHSPLNPGPMLCNVAEGCTNVATKFYITCDAHDPCRASRPNGANLYALTCESCGVLSPIVTDEDAVDDAATDDGWFVDGHNDDPGTQCPACRSLGNGLTPRTGSASPRTSYGWTEQDIYRNCVDYIRGWSRSDGPFKQHVKDAFAQLDKALGDIPATPCAGVADEGDAQTKTCTHYPCVNVTRPGADFCDVHGGDTIHEKGNADLDVRRVREAGDVAQGVGPLRGDRVASEQPDDGRPNPLDVDVLGDLLRRRPGEGAEVARCETCGDTPCEHFAAMVEALDAQIPKPGISCSFCRKTQSEVKKLVQAWPENPVTICDECIGLCNAMMAGAATPSSGADPLHKRAADWVYFEDHRDEDASCRSLVALLADVRRETIDNCAAIAAEIAELMENGAGETKPGERLRQAERMIRAGLAKSVERGSK